MEIWRALKRQVDQKDWIHIGEKIYKEKRHATSLMRNRGGYDAIWDDQEKLWVSADGKWIFKIQKAEVAEWRDFIA